MSYFSNVPLFILRRGTVFVIAIQHSKTDVILIDSDVMSATLGTLLKELPPERNAKVFEKSAQPGEENSSIWNDAGTGHSALCELSYTKEGKDGTVDCSKAIRINRQYQISKRLWAYLVRIRQLDNPDRSVQAIPHMSSTIGEDNVAFIKNRVVMLKKDVLFERMKLSQDEEKTKPQVPLIIEGRKPDGPVALTYDETGIDVNLGVLAVKLSNNLEQHGVEIRYKQNVLDIRKQESGVWLAKVKDLETNETTTYESDFVFIGVGGTSLPLLQKTGIKQSEHIGGLPVSRLFLRYTNQGVIDRHHAKVYGEVAVGASPMSAPHLDTCFTDGKRSLLFGPFAGFLPKFLKTGSHMDLIKSVKPNNIVTMLSAGIKEMSLTEYLMSQLMLSSDERIDDLRVFFPNVKNGDWEVITAGQRAQVIRDTEDSKGNLQFGTEVITSDNGTLAALLGASPDASTAIDTMFDVLQRYYRDEFKGWGPKIKEMVLSFGYHLIDHEGLYHRINGEVTKYLQVR